MIKIALPQALENLGCTRKHTNHIPMSMYTEVHGMPGYMYICAGEGMHTDERDAC